MRRQGRDAADTGLGRRSDWRGAVPEGDKTMIRRPVSVLWLAALALCSNANADILRCQVKSTVHGHQERLIDIVVPTKDDYRYELGLIDGSSRAIVRHLAAPFPLGGLTGLGLGLEKGFGTIEIRTRVVGGEYITGPERLDLVVFSLPNGDDLTALFFRNGLGAGSPGIVRVDRTSGKKTITMTDGTHQLGLLTFYEGKCE
jgi:hypothetical protein